MVDRMCSYKKEVYACVRTVNPDLFSVDTILESQAVLAQMQPPVKDEIEKIAARFENFMPAHFWLGLYWQATGNHDQALFHLRRARTLGGSTDWQVALRLAFLCRDLGQTAECLESLQIVANHMPPHPLRALCLQMAGQMSAKSLFPFQRNNQL